jgi:hypothetical protein
MKSIFILWTLAVVAALPAWAQAPIYRCGNEYTNTKPDASVRGCKLVEGGNVTVVQAARVPKAAAKANQPTNAPVNGENRIAANEQKARDSDARLILQSELNKAMQRQDALQKEYNNGAPERLGEETRNYQKYLDRVAELKASLARNEGDIAGIRRELERLPAAAGVTAVR